MGVYTPEPNSGQYRQHECLWTTLDPDLYMCQKDLFLFIFLLYFSYCLHPKRHYNTPPSLTHHKGQILSGDDLFSALKASQSFSNSNLGHLWHSLDSNHLPVPEMLWSTSYSKPLPAVPNTTAHSFHPNPSPDTPSEGCSETSTSSKSNLETSSNSTPSNSNSALTFSRYSQSCSRDRVAPAASNIKGCIIKVIRDIKGQGWSGSVGNAG